MLEFIFCCFKNSSIFCLILIMIIWGKQNIFTLLFSVYPKTVCAFPLVQVTFRHIKLKSPKRKRLFLCHHHLHCSHNFPAGGNKMVRNLLEVLNIKLAVYTVKHKPQLYLFCDIDKL